ncbi:C40 family peptidase [Brevibacillus sp. NPDC058079]|uniref:C40 family peptidase n=1 Tax=Brevibacillus sp. NPDC058079 TaxID=3346330 RepID=UPI0036E3CC8E
MKKIVQVSVLAVTAMVVMATPAFAQSPKKLVVSQPVEVESETLSQIVSPLIGVKYIHGGNSVKGFDASGFTQYVMSKQDIKVPRTTDGQRELGETINKQSDMQEGDLVFFKNSEEDSKGAHVGIALGENKVALVTTTKGVTIIDVQQNKYWSKHFVEAKRIK